MLAKYGIDAARLESFERQITCEPHYFPQALDDFKAYLWTLKKMHSSDDIDMLIEECWEQVGEDTQRLMRDLQKCMNRNVLDVYYDIEIEKKEEDEEEKEQEER